MACGFSVLLFCRRRLCLLYLCRLARCAFRARWRSRFRVGERSLFPLRDWVGTGGVFSGVGMGLRNQAGVVERRPRRSGRVARMRDDPSCGVILGTVQAFPRGQTGEGMVSLRDRSGCTQRDREPRRCALISTLLPRVEWGMGRVGRKCDGHRFLPHHVELGEHRFPANFADAGTLACRRARRTLFSPP